MVRLIALKAHQPGLTKVKKGERYDISSDQAAKRLVIRGLAKYADEPEKKREYHRRDMKAER